MYQSGLRSLSLVFIVCLLSSTPAASILMSASELCAAEGCKLEDKACFCPRDLESVRHSLETKAAHAHRQETKASLPYVAFMLGGITNLFIGAAIIFNTEWKDGILTPRSSIVALFFAVSSVFGYNAFTLLNSKTN